MIGERFRGHVFERVVGNGGYGAVNGWIGDDPRNDVLSPI